MRNLDRYALPAMSEMSELTGIIQDRIAVLQSELRRLKARLAAQAGEEDLMNFILNRSDVDVDYIQDLRTRLE